MKNMPNQEEINPNPNGWIPFLTLLEREIRRYLENPTVTIAPPIMSQILYILIFGLILGTRIGEIAGYSYISFMFPGLVMMALLMNSFMNPSWSLFAARHFGWIEPILSSPLSYNKTVLAYTLAAVSRGLLVGIVLLLLGLALPVTIAFAHPFFVVAYMIVVSVLAAGFGCIAGLWAEKFDHVALIMNFVLFPLIFLGGVFYSLQMIEGITILETIVKLNPITYMINGLRYGMIGLSEVNVTGGLLVLSIIALALLAVSMKLFHSGYNLRD